MVERAVYIQYLKPDWKEEYLAAHESVPKGVTNAMVEGGVERFDLYVRGDIAVCVLEAEDVDAYLDRVSGDPTVEAWERRVAEFKREGVDVDAAEGEQIPFMDRVWSFERD
jgi:L-rhamnose mutarotase